MQRSILVTLLIICSVTLWGNIEVSDSRKRGTEILNVVEDGQLVRLEGCKEGLMTKNKAIFTMLRRESEGEIKSIIKIISQIRKFHPNEHFSSFILSTDSNPLKESTRTYVSQHSWEICTVNTTNSSIPIIDMIQLWFMNGPELIIYIDPRCYITADVSGLLSKFSDSTLGATLNYENDWTSTFNAESVLKITPSDMMRQRITRQLVDIRNYKTVSEFLNSIIGIRDWYDLGYRYSASTKLFVSNQPFWDSQLPDVRIIFYEISLPWNRTGCVLEHEMLSTDLCEMWWGLERSTTELRISMYEKLWKKSSIDKYHTAEPLKYYPQVTPDPLPHQFNSTPDRLDEIPIIMKDYSIVTVDRRVHRIERKISNLNYTIFPNSQFERNKVWKIVMGIPSTDTVKANTLRQHQRSSFFKYKTVWNVHRHPDSQMLIKYLLAYHPSNNYSISQGLITEAEDHSDIIFFNIREGAQQHQKNNKLLWERKPVDVLVGMSRKTYAWFAYAADNYKTDYVIKGDDDAFYRCNMLVHELTAYQLPRVYYGRKTHYPGVFGMFRTTGMIVTLSFDLVDWLRDSTIAEQLTDFIYEDVMVGLWFYKSSMNSLINNISDCRCHDVNGHFMTRQHIRNNSLVMHHIPSSRAAYVEQFLRFPDSHLRPLKIKTKSILENMLEEPWETVYWNERYICPSQFDRFWWKLEASIK